MNNRMEPEDLARFIEKARSIFRGEWDERIWELGKSRIIELRPSLAMKALHDYGVMHGGERARFIPGKFLEVLEGCRLGDDEARARARRQADQELAAIARDEEQRRVANDWMDRRHEIESASPATVAEAVAFLMERRWSRPPASVSDWSRAMLLAVSDLVTDRRIDDRGRTVSAWEFWSLSERNPNGYHRSAIISAKS